MKFQYLIFIILALILNSCSSTTSKLENKLTNEIGVKPTKLTGKKDVKYAWKKVSLEKSKTIKNSIDKILDVLPSKDSGIQNFINIEKPYIYQYWVWETPDISVELDYNYNDDYDIDVELFITNK